MKLMMIGLIIGIGKVIPGVSGAMLAISLGVYEKAIDSITNFFNNPKANIKFLLLLGSGIFLAIVLGSKLIIYLFSNYYFITMMFFIGLIISSIFDYGKRIKYTVSNSLIMGGVGLIFILISIFSKQNTYELTGNFNDVIIFFIGGIIEIFSSLVPGISGTALLMILGIYEQTLTLFSSIYNFNYVIENINLYLSYGIGMGISFILVTYGINYLFKYQRMLMESLIMGFTVSSIIILIRMINFNDLMITEYLFGILSLIFGLVIGNKGLEKT